MIKKTKIFARTLAIGGAALVGLSQMANVVNAQDVARYLPEFTADGQLILPKGFNEWVYVGSPLTPDGLNGGKAGFPEYHNVYIERGSYDIYKKTNAFPEGTIMFKELQRVLSPENPNGSRTEVSGVGYFPGALNGADVAVKDSKRFASTNGWGYFNFNHSEPKLAQSVMQPNEKCAYCHTAGAKKDMVWTQFYRLLDK
jgi:hypothetical protein